jgi:hypothetical protein
VRARRRAEHVSAGHIVDAVDGDDLKVAITKILDLEGDQIVLVEDRKLAQHPLNVDRHELSRAVDIGRPDRDGAADGAGRAAGGATVNRAGELDVLPEASRERRKDQADKQEKDGRA